MTPPPAISLLAFCSATYEDVALNELAALLGARLMRRLSPGALLLQASQPVAALIARVEVAPPVFTRQLLVGVAEQVLTGAPLPDVDAVLLAAPSTALASGRALVCDLEGRSPATLSALGSALTTRLAGLRGTAPAGSAGGAALAVVVADQKAYVGLALLSAGLPTHDHPAPLWPGGRPRLPYLPDLVSRSALKLLEALEIFAISAHPDDRALDLGAAPGGWTQMLALRGLTVTAVDPGEVEPRVAALPGVRVYQMTAQSYLHEGPRRFDLLVNDMRLDARESSRLMVQFAPLLVQDGVGLMTLKLPQRGPTAILRYALDILRSAFPEQHARCLFFNRNEVTVCLRR